jgi:UDP-glucuronate decarboxylase
VEGINLLMTAPDEFTGPVNLGNPLESTIRELAETILRLTGSKSKLAFLPLPADDPRQRQPDITVARNMLGWKPKITVDDGLKETISYFRHLLAG